VPDASRSISLGDSRCMRTVDDMAPPRSSLWQRYRDV
jgi:hypothetical protein